jgi:hypothetical protein
MLFHKDLNKDWVAHAFVPNATIGIDSTGHYVVLAVSDWPALLFRI